MGLSVLILGKSGSGKSTAIGQIPELGIIGLDPKETIIISSLGKENPWRNSGKDYSVWNKETNSKGNMVISSDPRVVLRWLHYINTNIEMQHIKNIVLEDSTHSYSMEYMRRINEKSFDKFNEIADFMTKTAMDVKSFRKDLCVFFNHHIEDFGDDILIERESRAMTIGKLVDNKLSGYESFFTMVLVATKKSEGEDIKYCFLTRQAKSTCKTPIGMFSETEIPNDLGFVRRTMDCYYNGENCNEEEVIKKVVNKK